MSATLKINDHLSYDSDSPIGNGIYSGTFKHLKVAVKRSEDPYDETEIKIMQEVCDSHHAIIRFHGTYNDLTHHFLVLEHFAATMKDFVTAELNNHIISKIKRKNKTSEKHQLRQITEGLNFLHKKNIAIGDLMPENILLDSQFYRAKISNFTSATKVPVNQTDLLVSDIEKLGELFVYVLTANKSFEYLKVDHYEIEDQELAKDLIESMTQSNLQDCPLPEEILIHPYFWEPMKKLDLIIDIRKCSHDKKLRDAIDLDVSVIKDINLHPLQDAFVWEDIKKRSDDISKISNLLRYIRNKWAHSEEWNKGLKKTFGDSATTYMKYWEDKYPKLIKHIYNATKSTSKNDQLFSKYFKQQLLEVQTKCLVLDLAGNSPELEAVFEDLQDLTLLNFKDVQANLKDFLAKNCNGLSSLTLRDFELSLGQLGDILKLTPKLNKIELIDFILNSQATDENLSFPALENLHEVRIENKQDHRVAEVLKHSKNLQKIDVKVHSIEDSLIDFVMRQKLLKILIFYSNKFPLVEHVDFQLNSLKTQVFIDVGDNVMNTKGGYSSAVCENFLKFILTQNQLEDVRTTIEMRTFSEYRRYFDHILSLSTLKSFNVDSSDECANYFETTKIVNEHVENLKIWQHRSSRNDSSIMGRITMIFPNKKNLSFTTNSKLCNRSEIIVEQQGFPSTQGSKNKSFLEDFLLQTNLMKNLTQLTIVLESPSQLKFLQLHELDVFNVYFYDIHKHCGSIKNFFDNNPSLNLLKIIIKSLNVAIYSKEYN